MHTNYQTRMRMYMQYVVHSIHGGKLCVHVNGVIFAVALLKLQHTRSVVAQRRRLSEVRRLVQQQQTMVE